MVSQVYCYQWISSMRTRAKVVKWVQSTAWTPLAFLHSTEVTR